MDKIATRKNKLGKLDKQSAGVGWSRNYEILTIE
jgi:hypothetical protein